MFSLAYNEHRTRRRAHDTLRCAADRKMFPARVAVGCDDDEIDIEFFCGFDDLVRWQTEASGRFQGTDTSGVHGICQPCEFPRAIWNRGNHRRCDHEAVKNGWHLGLDDVKQYYFSLKFFSEAQRILQSLF